MSKNHQSLGTPETKSVGLTPEKVRDVLVECLLVNQPVHEKPPEKIALKTLRASFKQVGGNYDHPTKEHLQLVVQALANKTVKIKTSAELVERHRSLVMILIGELA